MPRRKSRNSTNYLLEFLEKTDEDLAKDSDVYKFIEDYKLMGDVQFLPNSLIYYIYCKDGKYKQYKRVHFFKLFKHFFRKAVHKGERGYMVSSLFKASDEDYKNARSMTRKEIYGRQKK